MTLGAKRNKKKFEDLPPHVQKTGLRVIGLVCLLGWLLLIGCGVYAWDDMRFARESVEDTAEVIGMEEDRSYDSDTGHSVTYSPTFRFKTEDGRSHTVTPWYQSSEWGFSVGQQITIRYRPGKPEKAIPYGYGDQWLGVPLFVWIPLAIGGFCAFFGTLGSWDLRRRMRYRQTSDDA